MKQILLIFLYTSLSSNAQTIDKQKVLSIIKAAKKGQPITAPTTINRQTKENRKKETIIVYRRKPTKSINIQSLNHTFNKPSQPILTKSTLPNIPPTSVMLRNRFLAKDNPLQNRENTPLFKTPKQSKHQGMNTTAKKINYY